MIADRLASGNAGKIIVVGKSAIAHRDTYSEIFVPDADGKVLFAATVDAAVGLCTADSGDTIYVLPGHTETVTASSLTLDVAGINVVCLGSGSNRPTFTYGAAAATITVSAKDITWKGGYFVGNFLDVASAFTIGAAKDFKLEGAEFEDNSAILNFLSIVTTGTTANAADGLKVIGCSWFGLNTTPLAFVSILGNTNHLVLTDNFVDSASTADVGHFLTITADVLLGAQIRRNTLVVVGSTGATVGIFLTGSSTTNTGIVANNYVASLDTTTELISTASTGLKFFENYYTGTADASGKLWPVVDGA